MRHGAYDYSRQLFILLNNELLMIPVGRNMVRLQDRQATARFRGYCLVLFQNIVIMYRSLYVGNEYACDNRDRDRTRWFLYYFRCYDVLILAGVLAFRPRTVYWGRLRPFTI